MQPNEPVGWFGKKKEKKPAAQPAAEPAAQPACYLFKRKVLFMTEFPSAGECLLQDGPSR